MTKVIDYEAFVDGVVEDAMEVFLLDKAPMNQHIAIEVKAFIREEVFRQSAKRALFLVQEERCYPIARSEMVRPYLVDVEETESK